MAYGIMPAVATSAACLQRLPFRHRLGCIAAPIDALLVKEGFLCGKWVGTHIESRAPIGGAMRPPPNVSKPMELLG